MREQKASTSSRDIPEVREGFPAFLTTNHAVGTCVGTLLPGWNVLKNAKQKYMIYYPNLIKAETQESLGGDGRKWR